MKPTRVYLLFITSFILSGCISTQVKDFTDPEYTAFKSHKLLLMTPSKTFDGIFLETLNDKNIDVTAHKWSDLFLPTREYSKDEIRTVVKDKGYDSAISIIISGVNSSNHVVSYTTTSNVQGSSSTVPVVAHSRNTTATAVLLDTLSRKKIWVADLETKAKGGVYVQNDDTMESISDEIINALLQKGHLSIKKANIKEN